MWLSGYDIIYVICQRFPKAKQEYKQRRRSLTYSYYNVSIIHIYNI